MDLYLLNDCYMKMFRLLLLASITIVSLALISLTKTSKKSFTLQVSKKKSFLTPPGNTLRKLEQKAAAAKIYVNQNGYNENLCCLIDMNIPSGQNRFFIYDLKKDSIRATGLVAHGNCFEYWLEGRRYSNVVGSGCTSVGKYKIGNPYTGKFGYSYKLHGLDSSNNNAFERTVVLHSHHCIPESEVTEEICQSNGCPTVSPGLLMQLKSIINNSKKPLLLWIYD